MKIRISSIIGLSILLLPAGVSAQTYTLAPSPFLMAFDNAGSIINNACIWTYTSGTSTPATTYSDSTGTTNANPIRSDSAGRFTAYLVPGTAYKFVYESACTPPAHGTTLRTADPVNGVPLSAANVDRSDAVAGEALSAGNCAYLSDGSGGKTAGQWWKCDSANTYSSTLPEVGVATGSISASGTGTIRLMGLVTGLSSLSVGSEYFVSTAGAMTTTAPANKRHLGHAETATSFVLTGDPAPPTVVVNTYSCGLRATLTTATPVTTADVTAATSVFVTPYAGGQCAFYDGSVFWTTLTNTEVTVSVPATTSTPFDIFCRNNSGTMACDTTNWTNDTTRATALTTQNGVLVKSGDTTRRYIATGRTTTVSGQTEDSFAKRYLWNYYNRVPRPMRVLDSTDTWSYSTNTYRQARATATNQLDFVIGVAEVQVSADVFVIAFSNAVNGNTWVAIGEDSTTTADAGCISHTSWTNNNGAQLIGPSAHLTKYPAVGRHTWVWLEKANAATTTWAGDNAADGTVSGIHGWLQG